ncbi:uncharacterized protein LOC131643969 [Vicia villosa]|uniref:uncharacterized protein LOC131643969 n=1 Tax=Vicia villosa TaxID=3911 RepID=UPI00273AEBDB|nr:uncharacterized protein LOC131643969 [Vicia villosa]
MEYSSSSFTPASGTFETYEDYMKPIRTLTSNTENLEVLCEAQLDFQSLKENGCDLTADIEAQGWYKFFDLLHGPVYTKLVKEFWIHATAGENAASSNIMGKKISIIEDSIEKIISHDGNGIKCTGMAEKCLNRSFVTKEIFADGDSSTRIKDLMKNIKVWAKDHSGNHQSQESYSSL